MIHLYWWESSKIKNFGDILGLYLVKKFSTKEVRRVEHPSMRRYKYVLPHFLTIGSIISECNSNSVVWGSGIIKQDQKVRNSTFLAVRGPRTRDRLKELDYVCPKLYGDPALLLPLFYKKEIKKKFKVGIVPHYADYDLILPYKSRAVNIIDLNTPNIEGVIDEVRSCEVILSSSLHGLIIAHAYGISAGWIKLSNRLAGDDTKFYDYLESVYIYNYFPQVISPKNVEKIIENLQNEDLQNCLIDPSVQAIDDRVNDLLISCPFNKGFMYQLKLFIRVKIRFLKGMVDLN